MAEKLFKNELARNIGSDIEISTDTVLVDGLLENVKGNIVTVIETVEYGSKIYRYFPIDKINFVRLL